mmetsp:Transcript_14372/g.25267  ORF Transcript_14372/g.25267 Transcript_14372/m.25267 type:complete len:678 (-) Transcript_14372:60-2093(-)
MTDAKLRLSLSGLVPHVFEEGVVKKNSVFRDSAQDSIEEKRPSFNDQNRFVQQAQQKRGLLSERIITKSPVLLAHKGEVLLRMGEEPRSVLLIRAGTLRVYAAADNSLDCRPNAKGTEVGRLGPKEWVGAFLVWQQKRARFSFSVISPKFEAWSIPLETFTQKLVPLMGKSFWDSEDEQEKSWDEAFVVAEEALAKARLERERAAYRNVEPREVIIPPNLKMRICPDLAATPNAQNRKDPPPPKVEPTLQEVHWLQREVRLAERELELAEDDSDEDDENLQLARDLSSASAPRRAATEGATLGQLLGIEEAVQAHSDRKKDRVEKAKARLEKLKKGATNEELEKQKAFHIWLGKQGIFKPPTAQSEAGWKASEVYQAMKDQPVLMPEQIHDENDALKAARAQEAARQQRLKKRSMDSALYQLRGTLKSGKRTLFNKRLLDLDSLFDALDHDSSGGISVKELADGLKRLGLSGSSVDDLMATMDADEHGMIARAAFTRVLDRSKTPSTNENQPLVMPSRAQSQTSEALAFADDAQQTPVGRSIVTPASELVLSQEIGMDVIQEAFGRQASDETHLSEILLRGDLRGEHVTSPTAGSGRPRTARRPGSAPRVVIEPLMPTAPPQKDMAGSKTPRRRPQSSPAGAKPEPRKTSLSFRAFRTVPPLKRNLDKEIEALPRRH